MVPFSVTEPAMIGPMNIRLRQDAIVRRLRRHETATVAELATSVGASRRTVLRDLGVLRDQGFVIHSEAGRGGGLRLDPRSVQTASRLSVPEIFALLISVSAMRAAGTLPFSDLADSGLSKLEAALPADKLRDLRAMLACLHIGTLSPLQDVSNVGALDSELLSVFQAAYLGRNRMHFRYSDKTGAWTDRIVEPQAILILPPLWYLVAWDPDRDGFRHFRMDRIKSPGSRVGESFRRRHVPFEDDVCPYSALTR
jgi:predicted DNA-binding transcriptional regulator YafY